MQKNKNIIRTQKRDIELDISLKKLKLEIFIVVYLI